MNSPVALRPSTWLAGGQLSLVLHIGDGPLAYEMSDQGHVVTVVGPEVSQVRDPNISYVRADGERFPFASASFDVVIAPHVDEAASTLAEYARVLNSGGLLSCLVRGYDDSIPWVRKLRTITADSSEVVIRTEALRGSGLFEEPEQIDFSEWENLDFAKLMQFAEETRHRDVPRDRLAAVQDLWREYAAGTGTLRLRHETHCLRARVNKTALPSDPDPTDALLISFD